MLRDCPNPKITVQFQDGDALISRSRSIRATKFLKETKDDLLCFLDDDVSISAIDYTKLMWLAYKEGLDIVGAAYATKSKTNPGFAVRPLQGTDKLKFGNEGGVYEMKDISSGCMVIRREVLEKMISSESVHLCTHGERQYYPFFQHREVEDDGVWEDKSEDWFFCYQARQLGFKVWMDSSIRTGHTGAYEFDWSDVYETKAGLRKTYDNPIFNITVPSLNGNEAVKTAI
mgnify:CR=1 FL=1